MSQDTVLGTQQSLLVPSQPGYQRSQGHMGGKRRICTVDAPVGICGTEVTTLAHDCISQTGHPTLGCLTHTLLGQAWLQIYLDSHGNSLGLALQGAETSQR